MSKARMSKEWSLSKEGKNLLKKTLFLAEKKIKKLEENKKISFRDLNIPRDI